MKLSICIPTYNRAGMLLELLESIVEQISGKHEDEVEIAISDNCSTDDTSKRITEYKTKHKNIQIVYSINKENIGPDRNYIRCVEIAHGDYAWIMGSDDKVNDDVLDIVLKQIDEGHSMYLSNRENYTFKFEKHLGTQYFFKKELADDCVIDLSSNQGWDYYFNLCEEIGGVCSYLSSFFFKREMFLGIKDYEPYIGSAYVHVYMVFKGLLSEVEPTIKILNKSIVKCRLGNDSFFENGYQRIMLDYEGYIKLSELFSDPLVNKDFLRILGKHSVSIETVLRLNKKQRDELIKTLKIVGHDKQQIYLIERMSRHKLLAILLCIDKATSRIRQKTGALI